MQIAPASPSNPSPDLPPVKALRHDIQQLSDQRDVFIKQYNDAILTKARQVQTLTGQPEHVRLATLNFRKIEGVPMGDKGVYEYLRNKSDHSAVILPLVTLPTGEPGVVFIQANEPALDGKPTISLPGGFLRDEDPSESDLKACLRELKEEVQMEAGQLSVLDEVVYAPRSSREYMKVAVAQHLKPLKEDRRDEVEKLTQLHPVTVPLSQVNDWLDKKRQEGFAVNAHVEMALRRYERALLQAKLKPSLP